MRVRRIGALALGCAFTALLLPAGAGARGASKELARIKGTVGYRAQADAPFQPVLGKLDLADDAWAITEAASAASLRLADSSEVELGERTSVQVGAFNEARSGKQNVVVLDHGALHFKIRHPEGVRSNYTFQTGTSQIAVRGTEAYLVVGPKGTQLVCVECTAGDVTITTGARVMTIVTGQTATILGSSPLNAALSVAQNGALHNPALDQFAASHNALIANASVAPVDPTGAVVAQSGATTAAAGGAAGVVGAAAGAAAVAAVAAGHGGGTSTPATTPGPTASPTPSPAPTATPTPGPTATPTPAPTATPTPPPTATPTPAPTATSTPAPTATPTTAPTATPTPAPTATPTPAPTATPTPAPTATPTTAPTATPTPAPTATPTAVPTATPTPTPAPAYGPLNVNPNGSLTLNSSSPRGSFTVQQNGPSGTIVLTLTSCSEDVESLDIAPRTVPIGQAVPTTISVTAYGHGHSEPKGYCTIGIQGGGGMAATMNVAVTKQGGDGGDGMPRSPATPGKNQPAAPSPVTKPESPAPAGVPHPTPVAGPGPAAPGRPGPGLPH